MLTNANFREKVAEKNAYKFYCQECNFKTSKYSNFELHLTTQKHKNATNANKMLTNANKVGAEKEPVSFLCKLCNYSTPKYANYQKHLGTDKHKSRKVAEKNAKVTEQKMPDSSFSDKPDQSDLYCPVAKESFVTENISNKPKGNSLQCECGKIFQQKSSLSRHKKTCSLHVDNKNTINGTNNKNMLCKCSCGCEFNSMDLFNEHQKTCNNGLVQKLIEQNTALIQTQGVSNSHNNTMTNSHNNSHNKTFNLNFFLNETCKDAMNITDFVNSLKLTIQDLENVGQVGYSEGISQMFVKGLNDLEVEKRPIHCSDLKREVIHIKDQDRWEQDTANRDRLKQAIKDLSTKNLMLMDDWQKLHPGCKDPDNSKNDLYLKMMVESLGPADEVAERKDMGKIIRSIAKTTIIKKSELK
jgi:hypothetical protein